MAHPWWATAIQWIVWGLLMSAIMGWVARSRKRTLPKTQHGRLRYPITILIIGLAGMAFFLGLAILGNVLPLGGKTAPPLATAVFLGFATLAAVMTADYFLSRHFVTEEGIDYGRLTGRRGKLDWSEVIEVRYSESMKWFRLKGHSGAIARVSAMVTGLPDFARLVLAHVPPDAIDPQTRDVLEATAAGNLPKVWG